MTSAAACTGVATTTRSASWSIALGGQGPERHGPGRHPGRDVTPLTCQPRSRRAMPTEPPMRPVPDDHGPPDQPGATGRDRAAGAVSRGGRHGVPGRPRGRRGGSRPGAGRW